MVLRSFYVARHLTLEPNADGELLRRHVWQSRGEFVRLLQTEMGGSLRHLGTDSAGEHIPTDPRQWPAPTRRLAIGLAGSR
jgi:hypothetical protein